MKILKKNKITYNHNLQKKITDNILIIPCTKYQSRRVIGPNRKSRIMKFLEANTRKYPHYLAVSKDFLKQDTKCAKLKDSKIGLH